MAHSVLLEQVERLALADRAALLTAAVMRDAENYQPLDPAERVREWETWLASDPTVPAAAVESFADRVARFQEQVAELDKLTEVA